ncbi:MAG: DoxX family protein [Phycisphaeraceae bacterium]|nr:MAG: DoxX family protein [Phycisphaeraceae bacterium]
MRTRDTIALALAPLSLRLMLAAIFLFAGLNKVIHTIDASPEQAAQLANLGAISPPPSPSSPSPDSRVPPLPDPTAPTPIVPPTDAPTPPPTGTPTGTPESAPPDSTRADAGSPLHIPHLTRLQPTEPAPQTPAPTTTPTKPEPTYTAADFPDGAKVKPGLMIALSIHAAAHPAPGPDGSTPMPLAPERLAQRPWPALLAWAAILTEIIAAALLVIGLFTRLSALGLASIMAVAMWLTEIGPAIQGGTAQFGFLPNYAMMDPAWQHLMLQFSLFASAVSLFFLGAGPASLDAAIFGGPTSAPKPAPAPKPRKPLMDD